MIFARNVAQPPAIFDIHMRCWWWFHILVCHLRCSFDQYQWSICWHCLLFNTRGRSQRPVPATSSHSQHWNRHSRCMEWQRTHTGPAFSDSSFFLCLTHFRPHWNDSVRYLRNAYICHFWHHFFALTIPSDFCSVFLLFHSIFYIHFLIYFVFDGVFWQLNNSLRIS